MKRFDLGISLDYCPDWGVVEAVREIFQNAYDEGVVDSSKAMFHDYKDGVLTIGNKNGRLATSSLLLGASTKRNNDATIGRHGEGYKVATVVLMRLGKSVKIYNHGTSETWTAKVVCSRRYGADVVVFDIEKSVFGDKSGDLVFEISGIDEDEYAEIVKHNLHLQDLNGKYVDAKGCKVLTDDAHSGMIFVGGLYVSTSKYARFGYDFLPELVKLDRDRTLIDTLDLQLLCAKVLSWTNDLEICTEARDTWDGEYLRYYVTAYARGGLSKLFDDAWDAFVKQYGKDAIPVTSTEKFNLLVSKGYKAALVKEKDYHFISNSSGYCSDGVSEPEDDALDDQLHDFWEKCKGYLPDDLVTEGDALIEAVIDAL